MKFPLTLALLNGLIDFLTGSDWTYPLLFALCLGDVTVAWPAGLDAPEWLEPREEVDVSGWEDACRGLPLSHMGRGPSEDPWFFAAAFAAGRLACR